MKELSISVKYLSRLTDVDNCSGSHSLLAVSRSDSTIEIWKTRHSPVFQFTIFPPAEVEVSVEGLAWAGDRLFSCGLHGQLVEYDLITRQERQR